MTPHSAAMARKPASLPAATHERHRGGFHSPEAEAEEEAEAGAVAARLRASVTDSPATPACPHGSPPILISTGYAQC